MCVPAHWHSVEFVCPVCVEEENDAPVTGSTQESLWWIHWQFSSKRRWQRDFWEQLPHMPDVSSLPHLCCLGMERGIRIICKEAAALAGLAVHVGFCLGERLQDFLGGCEFSSVPPVHHCWCRQWVNPGWPPTPACSSCFVFPVESLVPGHWVLRCYLSLYLPFEDSQKWAKGRREEVPYS